MRQDVCVRLDINLLVRCRHWAPSKFAMMSVWDSISTCWYVVDTGHHRALWCLCETWCQLVGMLQTLGTILVRYDVCVRLDINFLVRCGHWAPSKCAKMSVWDLMPTCWYVADIGHFLNALWCLCETRYQLVDLLQTLGTILVRYDVCETVSHLVGM